MLKLTNRSKIMSILKENSPEETRFIRDWSNDEEICNFISASLLIPQRVAKQLSDWKSLSIQKIEKAAREWKVSKDVLLWRALTLAPYIGGFFWCKTVSKPNDPTEIDLRLRWGKFPKSRKIIIPKGKNAVIHASTHSIVDFTGNEERFNWIKLDFEGLRGVRAIRTKAYGKGDEKRVLVIVYPKEIKPGAIPPERSVRQSILPVKY
jgi:hypothetical protein